jgi:hypothetical protein
MVFPVGCEVNELERACHPDFLFIIRKMNRALIYPRGKRWVLAAGSRYARGWRKEFPELYDRMEDAVTAAKRMGFGGYTYKYHDRSRTWMTKIFSDEKDWRVVYRKRS